MGFGIIMNAFTAGNTGDSTVKEWNRASRLLFGVVVLLIHIQQGRSSQVELRTEDVCKWQTFHANCSKNEVIIIASARYGRVKTGKCAQIEEGEEPCFADAQQYLDQKCGGRRTCEMTLPERVLDEMPSSCSGQRISYLEVAYHCQEIYAAEDQACIANRPISVLSPTGYLANILTDTTDKGSSLCPWNFQLQPEQTLNLTLLDFGIFGRTSLTDDQDSHCLIYAVLKDGLSSSGWSGNLVCGGGVRSARETILLTPMAKEVQIEVEKLNILTKDPVYFLIRYEVVGCPEFVAPDGALADKISNGGYRVTCKDSSLGPWNVQCVAGKWTPTQTISCATLLQRTTSDNASNALHLHQGLMIVIVLAVAIVISTIIIVIGIFLLQKRKSYSPPESLLNSPGLDKHGNMLYYMPKFGERCLVSGGLDRPMTDLERDYATTLQMRQMVLPLAVMHPECIPSPGGDVWMCPVHGARTAGIATGNGSLSRRTLGTYKPRMEHIYEAPATIYEGEVILAQNSGELLGPESPFYNVLDPNLSQLPDVSREAAKDLEQLPTPPTTSNNSGT